VSDAAAAEERTQRFAEAVRSFAGVPPKRFAALLPHRDGIAELRQKGASFVMIREILAMAGIEVARIPRSLPRGDRGAAHRHKCLCANGRRTCAAELASPALPPPIVGAPEPTAPAEPSRSRGPPIADPRNL
jgi:hypothetical protein